MPVFNGDVVFLDASGQVRASNGDLSLRADDTGTRSIIVGSGVSLRPDRDLNMDLGAPDLRWFRTHTGHLSARSGILGPEADLLEYPYMTWDSQGFNVQGDFPVSKTFAFTQMDVILAGGTLQLGGGADLTVDGTADFLGGITGTVQSSRIVPAFDNAGNENASVGGPGLRYDGMYASSGVFNHLAPPTSGTFIVVEDGDLVPIVDARRSVGALSRRWARMHAASGIFNTIGAPASGTRVEAAASIVPNRHNIYSLGTTGQRWANLFAASGTIATLAATTFTSTSVDTSSIVAGDITVSDLIVNRSITLDDGDGLSIIQAGPVTWDMQGSTLDISNGAPSFNDGASVTAGLTVNGGINTDTLVASSTVGITGTLTTRNIVPQTDRLYAIGTSALRYARMHAASGVFNQLAASTSGTFIQVNASLLPESDALYALGTSARRWGNAYVASGEINSLVVGDTTSVGTFIANGIAFMNGGTLFGNAIAPTPDATQSNGLQGLRWSQAYIVSGLMESIVPLPSGGYLMVHGHTLPGLDLAFNLGSSTNRWAGLHAGSGTFATRATIKGYPIVTNRDARTTVHAVVTANSGAIINSNAERDIYNYTVPANTLSASGKLYLECVGSFTNMAGANVNMTPRVYINGTNIWGDVLSIAQGPRPADLTFYMDICSLGSLTGQRVRGSIELATRTAGSVTGNGDFGTANVGGTWSSTATSGTVDFGAPVNLRVSMQLGTASTNASYSGFHCILAHQPFPTL